MLRRSFLALVMLALMPRMAVAGEFAEEDRAAIRQVIESQLAAFQRSDDRGAFAYASPDIQRRFGTPENFIAMVKTGYMAVYRPREMEFRELRSLRGQPIQEVLFVGPDGRAVLAVYLMERQVDGSWRIDGVFLVKSPDATT